MKAISLWQPWASAIPLGLKNYETRSWSTPYRGPIAIHAAKHLETEWIGIDVSRAFSAAGIARWSDLPLGGIVAVAELAAVVPTDGMDGYLSGLELAFGNYTPGRFAWRLERITPIEFYPCRGYQGLWEQAIP